MEAGVRRSLPGGCTQRPTARTWAASTVIGGLPVGTDRQEFSDLDAGCVPKPSQAAILTKVRDVTASAWVETTPAAWTVIRHAETN